MLTDEAEKVGRDPIIDVRFIFQNVFSGDPWGGEKQKQISVEASVKVVAVSQLRCNEV